MSDQTTLVDTRHFCDDDTAFFIAVEKFINWERKCQLCKNCQLGLTLKMYGMKYWKPSKKIKVPIYQI